MSPRASRICPHCKAWINTPRCTDCEKKRQPARDTKTPEERKFYGSALWKRIRAAKRRRNPLCEECAREGRITAMKVVDHKKPIREGGDPTDHDNLESLCGPHHDRKRQQERTRAAA